MMKQTSKIRYAVTDFWLSILATLSPLPAAVRNTVPYVSQFASPEYAEKILKDRVEKTTDPRWQNTSAESKEEYARWVLTICGMACTSMALRFFKNNDEGIISLAKNAFKHSVYKPHGEELSNMHYTEYVPWIKRYGLDAKVYTQISMRGLQYLLSKGKLVIVSVNPNIREYTTADPKQKGGHLVLLTGYDQPKDTVTLHNPSGFVSLNTQENHTIPVQTFCQYFAGRGIALSLTS